MTKKCSKEELDWLIVVCSIQRKSTFEALEYLDSHGFKIKERTYFKRKKKLKEKLEQKVTTGIENIVAIKFHLLDVLELIQKNLWSDYENTKDPNLRLKQSNTLRDNEILITKCFEEIPTIIERQLQAYSELPIGDKLNFLGCKKERREEKKQYLKKQIEKPRNPYGLIDPNDESRKMSLKQELEELESEDE